MSTPKIRTTVYSHKVVDTIKFNIQGDFDYDDLYGLFDDLMRKVASSGNGFVHIKVDRPLSSAEVEHRLGVVAKNLEKRNRYRTMYSRMSYENERREYERLKAKFEGNNG